MNPNAPKLRPYELRDRAACLRLFRGNVPTFFAPHEEAEFAAFLDEPGEYFVLEHGGKVVACGGVFVRGETGGLSWGMVARSKHRSGYGRALLRGRLEHLSANHPGLREVRLDTSQHSKGFFERFGFVATEVAWDGYAPGLHRFEMRYSFA